MSPYSDSFQRKLSSVHSLNILNLFEVEEGNENYASLTFGSMLCKLNNYLSPIFIENKADGFCIGL